MPETTARTRTLYHSALRSMGKVSAVLTHKPRASKYPGRPQYARVIIDGQDYNL